MKELRDYEIFKSRVGAVIKRRREDKRMTQAALAGHASVGIDQANIARIEKGKQGWDSATIFGLSRALQCSLADIFAEVENIVPEVLPPEAHAFAATWMELPPKERADYKERIEGLVQLLKRPVGDERTNVGHRPKQHHAKTKS